MTFLEASDTRRENLIEGQRSGREQNSVLPEQRGSSATRPGLRWPRKAKMRERLPFLLLLKSVPRGRLPVTQSVSLARRGSHRKAKSASQSRHRHLRRTSKKNHQSQRHRRPRQPRQPIHHEIIRFSSHEAKLVQGRRPLRRQSMEARNLDIIASLCSHGRYRYCLISGSKRLRKSPLAWSSENETLCHGPLMVNRRSVSKLLRENDWPH